MMWRVSMLPPPSCGGNGANWPGRSGAVPIVPQNGTIGISTPSHSLVVDPCVRSKWCTYGSGKSSGRSPVPSMIAHQPYGPVSSERTSTSIESPTSAPATSIGPARL